ncbi:MAG TPA: branched-chain amino acid ABC transporter permease [Acidimicrobiales bacterium]
MSDLLTVAWAGLTVGASYALVALGIVIAQRVTRVVNLAQGEFSVLGGFTTATLTAAGWPVALALVPAAALGGALAAVQEWALLRRLRDATGPILLLTTVALAVTFQGAEVLLWGRDPRTGPVLVSGDPVVLGGLRMSRQSLALVALAVVLTLVAHAVIDRSATGKAMSAVAEDPDAARMTGIDVYRLRLLGLVLAGTIGGLAGAVALPLFLVDFSRGLALSLKGFVAAVLGGSSVGGALAGGLALGVIEALTVRYVSDLFSDVATSLVLIAVVLAGPYVGRVRAMVGA